VSKQIYLTQYELMAERHWGGSSGRKRFWQLEVKARRHAAKSFGQMTLPLYAMLQLKPLKTPPHPHKTSII
jgi:hypothetical protein